MQPCPPAQIYGSNKSYPISVGEVSFPPTKALLSTILLFESPLKIFSEYGVSSERKTINENKSHYRLDYIRQDILSIITNCYKHGFYTYRYHYKQRSHVKRYHSSLVIGNHFVTLLLMFTRLMFILDGGR